MPRDHTLPVERAIDKAWTASQPVMDFEQFSECVYQIMKVLAERAALAERIAAKPVVVPIGSKMGLGGRKGKAAA